MRQDRSARGDGVRRVARDHPAGLHAPAGARGPVLGQGGRLSPGRATTQPRDVRMRGFAARADVEEVERFLAERARARCPAELVAAARVRSGGCWPRTCARRWTCPPSRAPRWTASRCAAPTRFGASDYDPLALRVIGEALPGRPFAGARRAGRGRAHHDRARRCPAAPTRSRRPRRARSADGRVAVREAVPPLPHVGARGEDVRAGETVLRAGRRLRPQDAGLLASIGAGVGRCHAPAARCAAHDRATSCCRPAAGPRRAHRGQQLARAARRSRARDGARRRRRASCCPTGPSGSARRCCARTPTCCSSRAAARSARRITRRALVAELGELDFHGVAMRPVEPGGRSGGIGGRCGVPPARQPGELPLRLRVLRAARRSARSAAGRALAAPARAAPARAQDRLAIGRVDYVRVAIERGCVVPLATSGASILSSTVRAAGAVIVPRGLEGMPRAPRSRCCSTMTLRSRSRRADAP